MDDDDFMQEDEDYGFEYESDDGEEPDVDLENSYYNAKALKEDTPKDAIAAFQKVVSMEPEKGEWGFKALKQMVKVFFRMSNTKSCLETYKQLLTYIKSAVTRNYSEKSINSILDHISSSSDMDFLESFYSATLTALEDSQNERLWFKTNVKLAKLWLDRGEYTRLNKILRALHQACLSEDGSDDTKKGTQLLEIYALEIQMYTATKNNKKLKELYNLSLRIKSAIPHPRIMGIIRECGGKMHMSEKQWEEAHKDFFEAFKNYDEAGSTRRIQCLKYLVLANVLLKSGIDPFTAQETKPYKNDPEITAMNNLLIAINHDDIFEFERILGDNRKSIMDDPFVRDYVEDMLNGIRTSVLIKLIKPYTRIELTFISKQLNISVQEVEMLLVSLILDGSIQGRIDQVNQRLELDQHRQETNLYNAMDKLSVQVHKLTGVLTDRIA